NKGKIFHEGKRQKPSLVVVSLDNADTVIEGGPGNVTTTKFGWPIYDNVPLRQVFFERTPPCGFFRAPFRSNGKRPAAKCCLSWTSPTKARVLNLSMEPRFH